MDLFNLKIVIITEAGLGLLKESHQKAKGLRERSSVTEQIEYRVREKAVSRWDPIEISSLSELVVMPGPCPLPGTGLGTGMCCSADQQDARGSWLGAYRNAFLVLTKDNRMERS